MLTAVILALTLQTMAQTDKPLPKGAEAISLSGKPLYPPKLSEESKKKLQDDLSQARQIFSRRPESIPASVWVGRRIAYLGQFQAAIQWYSSGLKILGPSAEILRHRGHRYITVRQLDRAIEDLEEAAKLIKGTPDKVEADGVPNARNTPVSSLHSNVWYHLALAHYLNGNFEKALTAADEGMKVSGNPDRLVSQTYWRYLILRRLGREAEAKKALEPINKDLDLIENHTYLKLLLVYKGDLKEEDVLKEATGDIDNPTVAFGLGSFHLLNGDKEKARQLFERAVSGPSWPAFGFIAAEAELQRLV
jgi:tetratricopeptide (TPR) repeat protein